MKKLKPKSKINLLFLINKSECLRFDSLTSGDSLPLSALKLALNWTGDKLSKS